MRITHSSLLHTRHRRLCSGSRHSHRVSSRSRVSTTSFPSVSCSAETCCSPPITTAPLKKEAILSFQANGNEVNERQMLLDAQSSVFLKEWALAGDGLDLPNRK